MRIDMVEKITLRKLLNDYASIIIPGIQRDYVLGSSGENLKNLLELMAEASHANKSFHFSCVMGHVDEGKNLSIYDGQQRITTLIYLSAYLCQKQQEIRKDYTYLHKFRFIHRTEANNYLHRLLTETKPSLSIEDFTTYSIDQLIKEFTKMQRLSRLRCHARLQDFITLDFLLNKVYIDCVLIDEVGDVEQFFIDLNDGLDLKDYEIYKAELYHKAKKLLGDNFNKFALAMENEWLQLFKNLKRKDEVEEEIAVLFIQYCLRMMWIEDGHHELYNETDMEWIEARHLQKIEMMLNHIVKLDLNVTENTGTSFINYSFGQDRSELNNLKFGTNKERKMVEKINTSEGVFWKISYTDYSSLLCTFLRSFYEKDTTKNASLKVKSEAKYDVLLWAYISHIDKPRESLNEYLRTIKILLNKHIIESNTAYYDNKHRLWFTNYSAYGIPLYYTDLKNSFARIRNDNAKENIINSYNGYLRELIQLNKIFLNFSQLDESIEIKNRHLSTMVHREQTKKYFPQYEEIRKFESLPFINGFIDNLLSNKGELLINYSDFLKKIHYKNFDQHESINNIVGKLLSEFSFLNIENLENKLFQKNLKLTWLIYTNNLGEYDTNVHLTVQTLNDFFIDNKFKPIFSAWINNENNLGKPLTDNILYLRTYRYLRSKGFMNTKNEIVHINNYYNNEDQKLGLYSNNPKRYYEFQSRYTTYQLKDKVKKLLNNGNLDRCIPNIQKSISYQLKNKWLQDHLSKKSIYYCEDEEFYFALLDSYIKSDYNRKQQIIEYVNNSQETIIQVEDKDYFVPYSVMEDYLTKWT